MRSPTLKINSKSTAKRPKIRRRKKHKLGTLWGLFGSDVSRAKIEGLNEVLRVHKTQKNDGKNSWKLVPKDSCEVYKARLKKSANDRKKQGNKQGRENQQSVGNKAKGRNNRTGRSDRNRNKRRRRDEEYISDSDLASCSTCSRCRSVSQSDSDMDCE